MVEGENRKLTSKEILCKLLFKAFRKAMSKTSEKTLFGAAYFCDKRGFSDESDFS